MARNQLTDFERQIRYEISENLKKLTINITQSELSEKTGIPQSTLSGYFAQRSTINPGNLQKIADALNVNKSDIDPRFKTTQKKETQFELSSKEKNDIGLEVEKMLSGLDSNSEINFYGEPMSDDAKEKMKIAMTMALELSKKEAKKKFTPKKFRK